MRSSQKVVATGAGVVALALVAAGITGCVASPAPSHTGAASLAHEGMQLGEVEPGTTVGTVKTSIYVPAFGSGVWLRMSVVDGLRTTDFCQVSITDNVQSSSEACSVEVFDRDKNGNLQGVVLHVDGLDEAGYFETDVRKIRRTEEGGWSGATGPRSVKLWGYLSAKGENKHE